MSADLLLRRPTLAAWLDEYAAIEGEYLDQLRSFGIEFAPKDQLQGKVGAVKRRLALKGAQFRNGGASIVSGAISTACEACSVAAGSMTFMLSMQCNRNCYFCFNVNQEEGPCGGALNQNWRDEVDAFADACGTVTHVGLTGGEPLLHRESAVDFVRYVHAKHPGAHIRLYTAGDFLNDDVLRELRDAGLHELRMSVKLDILDVARADDIIDAAIGKLALAKGYIPDVMVEMPVIPGTGSQMRHLLDSLNDLGIFGINLLEFGYPLGDWGEFARRGFTVKNPPFPVTYDYSYPGGLPIEGSELLCLELLEYALDSGLLLGVHYCSLENKNRGQVYRQNMEAQVDDGIYELDQSDFFYKALKLFDGDAVAAAAELGAQGVPFVIEESDGSLTCHPRHAGVLKRMSVLPALSFNVVERTARGCSLREVKLELVGQGA